MPAANPYVLTAVYFLGSLLVAGFGRRRKWGFWGYFWASLLMSPVLGVLFVLAGDKPPRRKPAAVPALENGTASAQSLPSAQAQCGP